MGLITVTLVACLSLTAAAALGEGVTWRVQGVGHGSIDGISCWSVSSCETTGFGEIPAYVDGRLQPHGISRPKRTMMSLSCAGGRCLAIGSLGARPRLAIQRSTGSQWGHVRVFTPHSARRLRALALNDVSCATASNCFAVGGALTRSTRCAHHVSANLAGLLASARGRIGALLPHRTLTAATSLAAVGCGSVVPDVEHLTGGRWRTHTKLPLPRGVTGKTFYGGLYRVSCSAPNSCEALGFRMAGRLVTRLFAERWDGHRWSVQRIPTRFPHAHGRFARFIVPFSLSCASAQQCIAVGFRGLRHSRSVVFRYDGRHWKLVHPPLPEHRKAALFLGASCAPGGPCMLVGGTERAHHQVRPLAELWDGSRWTRERAPLPKGHHGGVLGAVSCPSAEVCEVTGDVSHSRHGLRWFVDRYSFQP